MDIPEAITSRLGGIDENIKNAEMHIRVKSAELVRQKEWLEQFKAEKALLERAIEVLKKA